MSGPRYRKPAKWATAAVASARPPALAPRWENTLRLRLAASTAKPLWLGGLDGAQAYYRARLPAALVGGLAQDRLHVAGGPAVSLAVADGLAPLSSLRGKTLLGLGNPTVFRYSGTPPMGLDQLISSINAAGGNAWLECDDDYLNMPLANDAIPLVQQDWLAVRAAYIVCFTRAAHAARGVIVTTPTLAASIKVVNANVHIGPNVVNPADFPGVLPRPDGPLRVGYVGSIEHAPDLALVLPVLQTIACQRPVELHLWGLHLGLFHIEGSPGPFHCHGTLDFAGLHRAIAALDIALAPLETTSFNAARSATKWLEHSLHGTPMVVTDMAPYANLRGEAVVLKARSVEEFHRQLLRLIDDAALRQRIGQAARAAVVRHHGVEAGRRAWQRVINSCVAAAKIVTTPVFEQ